MKCENCRYLQKVNDAFIYNICNITHTIDTISCDIVSDNDVEDMDICFNCQYWYGLGDFGLSCAKNYYNCSHNGFDKACEQFKRRIRI